MYQRGSHWPEFREIWGFREHLSRKSRFVENLAKIPWKPKYVSLLPATLNRYTSWSEINGTRLFGQPSRYIHYAITAFGYMYSTLRVSYVFHKFFRTALIKWRTCMLKVLLHNADGSLPPNLGLDKLHSNLCYQSAATGYSPISATKIWLSRDTVPPVPPDLCRDALRPYHHHLTSSTPARRISNNTSCHTFQRRLAVLHSTNQLIWY